MPGRGIPVASSVKTGAFCTIPRLHHPPPYPVTELLKSGMTDGLNRGPVVESGYFSAADLGDMSPKRAQWPRRRGVTKFDQRVGRGAL